MGIFEIILFLIIALIVIPPDDLPQVMRAAGKVLRELRLASNTVMREISGAIGEDSPFNLLPPRFDDPPPAPSSSPSPHPPAFLAPQPQSQPPAEGEPPIEDASAPQTSVAGPQTPAEHQPSAPLAPPSQPEAPEHPERSMPPADKP
ncbi:MAG: twin-arginine translocase TatA/TatE family subunit [Candidatus Binataceae bacterium]